LFRNPDQRREAVLATASQTGFTPELIEKDWLLSLILEHISTHNWPLIFKGGTCLAKCHLDFYRLSEDLDFVHAGAGFSAGRPDRRKHFSSIETLCNSMVRHLDFLSMERTEKFDLHHQMAMQLSYSSAISREPGTVKLEITHREPLILTPVSKKTRTLVVHPILHDPLMKPFALTCMQLTEVVAEKVRACVTRPLPAIRDYYDLSILQQRMGPYLDSPAFTDHLQQKLSGTRWQPIPDSWMTVLKKQVTTELIPTLAMDPEFDLASTVQLVRKLLSALPQI